MGIQIAAVSVGNGINTIAQELPQERSVRQTQVSAEQKAAVLKEVEASLPGHNSNQANEQSIKAATADLQHISLAFNRKLQFVVDHESNEILIKVIDSETDKVIKVLPPEELQRLHSRIKETLGFLFDAKV